MDSSGIKRITCDLDTRDINDLIHCLKTFNRYGFNKELTIRDSPTGKGYHIICWSDHGVSKKKLIKIRRKAGDDPIRCDLDERSNRQIQVLFTHKEKVTL